MKRTLLLVIAILLMTTVARVQAKDAELTSAEKFGWRLGTQAYSFNRFTFFEAVDKTASLGLKWIEAYPGQRFSPDNPEAKFHHNMSEELMAEALEKLEESGVTLVNYGVVGLPNNEEECRKVFQFAQAMGIETICSEPPEDAFDLIDELCAEYKINVAIHNHPKPSKYATPEKVLEVCKGRSKRIGACADTGHWLRSDIRPLEALRMLEGRIISFHFKDLNKYGKEGAHDVHWGTGKAEVKALMKEIRRQGVRAVFSIEYEHNWENSVPDIAECIRYFQEVAEEMEKESVKKVLGTIKVSVGDNGAADAPVSVDLSVLPDPWRPLRLVEVKLNGKRVPVPSQIEPGDKPQLWWILSGETEANSERIFQLLEDSPLDADAVVLKQNDLSLQVICDGQKVFNYNHGFVIPPAGLHENYIRSGYIHPVWSPTGLMVTEDFADDHPHHKGIWFPWTKTEFEGRHPDFWNLKGGSGTVRFAGFTSTFSGPVFGGFKSKHEHVDLSAPEPKTALHEEWDVKVWKVGGHEEGYWLFDLQSVQSCATESPLILPEYRYGGLGFRGSVEWVDEDLHLITSEGKTRADGHATRSRWCDMSGPIQDGYSGVTIMNHPSNFRFPQHMRIWDKGGTFFCYSPSLGGDWSIEPGQPLVSKYRFIIHDGQFNEEKTEICFNNFAQPIETTFEPVKTGQ